MKCQVCDGDGIVRDVTAALSGNDACPHCHGSGLEPKGHDGQFDKQHSAWLIECVTAPTPLWFTGSFERDGRKRIAQFVADANGAVRYPSRAAAEWAFESLQEMRPRSILGNSCYRITEHEWFPSARGLNPIKPTDKYQEHHFPAKDVGVAWNGNRVWVCLDGIALLRAKINGKDFFVEFYPPDQSSYVKDKA